MLALAREIGGSYNLVFALHVSCVFHQVRGDRAAVEERAAELVALAAAQGFPHMLGTGTFFRGWARAAAGEVDEGIAGMVHGLAAKRATGAEIKVPYYQGLLAVAHATAGRSADGLALLAEALGRVERTGEVWFEAELHRLKGGVLLRTTPADPAEAEACFREAIDVARAHGTKWWELRAATSLARLWAERGECRKAHDLLAPVHGWFAEGFDTPDLKVAGALLDELAPAPLGSRARALLPTRS
jgi:predicted ATPase